MIEKSLLTISILILWPFLYTFPVALSSIFHSSKFPGIRDIGYILPIFKYLLSLPPWEMF